MSTRRATDNSLHQNRYASSPEFERGLLATLVAKRVSVLDRKADRELIWAIHYISHREGGLTALASDLIARYGDRIATATMLKAGKASSQNYSADEIRSIRLELPSDLRHKFLLKGELKSKILELRTKRDRLASQAEISTALRCAADNAFEKLNSYEDMVTGRREEREKIERDEAAKHPNSYPVAALRSLCLLAAQNGIELKSPDYPPTPNLERALAEICLDPAWQLNSSRLWYFAGLIETLRDYLKQWVESKIQSTTVTALGIRVADVLDYAWHSRSLVLVEGMARTGKSFAAKAWCEQHPGMARFVEVPPGNDESGFFRALSRGLGTGCSLNYKLGDLKERVESVLLTRDLVLVLDEGQRLWPTNLRHSYPHRINWIMAMANAGVAICIITTPQFIQSQKLAEDHGWNGAQLTGRIGHFEPLPATLELDDLMSVGKSVLPEVSKDVLRALAAYARTSARYLAAVDSIAKRARYIAQRAGRNQCNTEDVRTAMKESVIPSDTRLVRTLEKTKSRRQKVLPTTVQSESVVPQRITAPNPATNGLTDFRRRDGNLAKVI